MKNRVLCFAVMITLLISITAPVASVHAYNSAALPETSEVETRFIVDGAEWDLSEMDTITVGGIMMVSVDLLLELGLNGHNVVTSAFWSFNLDHMSFNLHDGITRFFIFSWQGNRGSSVRRIELDLPTIVDNEVMYIPLSAISPIIETMNDQVQIEVIQPSVPQIQDRVERGRESSDLWEQYSLLSVRNMIDMGYSRQDINYIFYRTNDYRYSANIAATQPSITLPNRRLTNAERQNWITEYREMGGASAFELEVVRLINEVRAEHNLSYLQIDDILMMSARFYAQILADLDLPLGHNEGPYATNPNASHGASANVARAFGGQLRWNGGNGSAGRRTPEGVVDGWMNSAGHRRYILSPEHRYIGVGTQLGGRHGVFHYMFLSDQSSRRSRR